MKREIKLLKLKIMNTISDKKKATQNKIDEINEIVRCKGKDSRQLKLYKKYYHRIMTQPIDDLYMMNRIFDLVSR